MAYIVAEPCVDVLDRACVEECPVDCIYQGERMAYIQPDECVDCGACEPVCPVGAIYFEEDLPEEWSSFTKINADFFATAGSPGGASGLAPGGLPDPEQVTRLARREAGR
ncbi:ferredoxin family protein [Microtetraspora sp. AC03309]|uniref:ferredoxin n=1 Tax=Microtetraspora sp. AC03309 TaxID=2779376 RepID=UPI001E4FB696|nr:ferredoxin [Microtetraspora sp. AC03309]MCC5575224.1 ferredoxin family protein [Microtetraspora sp. AC03309]